jgi:hypothetical protein
MMFNENATHKHYSKTKCEIISMAIAPVYFSIECLLQRAT